MQVYIMPDLNEIETLDIDEKKFPQIEKIQNEFFNYPYTQEYHLLFDEEKNIFKTSFFGFDFWKNITKNYKPLFDLLISYYEDKY